MVNWEEMPISWKLAITGAGIGSVFALAATVAGNNPKWSIGIISMTSGVCALGSLMVPGDTKNQNSSQSQFLLSAAPEVEVDPPSDRQLEDAIKMRTMEETLFDIRTLRYGTVEQGLAVKLASTGNLNDFKSIAESLPSPTKTAAPERVEPRVVQQPLPTEYPLYPPEYSTGEEQTGWNRISKTHMEQLDRERELIGQLADTKVRLSAEFREELWEGVSQTDKSSEIEVSDTIPVNGNFDSSAAKAQFLKATREIRQHRDAFNSRKT
jgi:hypothetical protein